MDEGEGQSQDKKEKEKGKGRERMEWSGMDGVSEWTRVSGLIR